MNKTVVALGVVSCALIAACAYFIRALAVQQDLSAAEALARQAAEQRVQSLEERYTALERSYAGVLQERNAPIPEPQSKPEVLSSRSQFADRSASYPNGFRLAVQQGEGGRSQRPMGPMMNANLDMARKMKLSDPQSTKFLSILAEEQSKLRQQIELNPGQPLDDQFVNALREETERQLREALGEDEYKEYEDYRRYQVEHQRINQLNVRLAGNGESALTQEQEQKLFDIMKEERNRVPAPTAAQFATRGDFAAAMDNWREDYNKRTQNRANTVLTGEQLTTFQTMRPGPFGRPGRRN